MTADHPYRQCKRLCEAMAALWQTVADNPGNFPHIRAEAADHVTHWRAAAAHAPE